MTAQEFNEKYKDHLEEGHYGLDVHIPEFIDWLDKKFQTFVTYKEFQYSQIKSKFGMGRFYCVGIPQEMVSEVEIELTKTLQTPKFKSAITKEFKVKLEMVDPTGHPTESKELSLHISDDPNSMIYSGQRLMLHVGEYLYRIDKKGAIVEQVIPKPN